MRIDIVLKAIKFNSFPPPPHISIVFPPPPPPPPHISIVFPPQPPPPPQFYCVPPPPPPHFHCFTPRQSVKDCKLLSYVQFVAMSQVVKTNRGFLKLLVQVLDNILKEYILIPEENKRNVLPYK